ncbi:alpha-1,3-mannosyl-glycoprotein 2-beta-N-acetylglucosaminyltransferase [Patella vulgata]|uniref:alpha-1,3-mannosyl-glycoprotein 2-beta-N-acetylglucosaminyltransferase n=1 Tax=Patella vulgata TaxID=6465 RepID=UPI00217F5146|nr:alpha-1,3-mannosyl-glycoprotein 2-beta-N-acetylglucosaminyltransferase [Patella vulgata]XP_050398755.1 alpha-1,3-mannosyl-glycoprotein 2-beta-N-acetylglucosaminyltransferase [Patella vulgata]
MRLKRRYLITVVVGCFVSWNLLTYYMLTTKQQIKEPQTGKDQQQIETKLSRLEREITNQLKDNKDLLKDLLHLKKDISTATSPPPELHEDIPKADVLPILMFACNRVTVSRSLDQLLKYRPSGEKFPIIVTQDCGHQPTATVIKQYVEKHGVKHIQQPDLREISLPWPQRKFVGYYKIARHYKWALNQVFLVYNYSAVIIVEDDLDISPDFYEYFSATYPLLKEDPHLWCVSAWNDNGKANLVSDEPELLYRSDFFPGLGWMIERSLWLELGPKWPETFWDDWMRHPGQRQGRECIRPEICRTSTFGKKGVSNGLFYEKHLKYIKLNEKSVPFTKIDLSYLKKETYDKNFVKKVYDAPLMTVTEVVLAAKPELPAARVQYNNKNDFKAAAKKLGIMDDYKAGVPRSAYRGVVSFVFRGRRIYLAPPQTWKAYDPTWS